MKIAEKSIVEQKYRKLETENKQLRKKLSEAEEVLHAIQSGKVDALVINTHDGNKIFTLEGADHSYRVFVETMDEGAATISPELDITYCNKRLSEILKCPIEQIIGNSIDQFILEEDIPFFEYIITNGLKESSRGEVRVVTRNSETIPVLIACCPIHLEVDGVCLIFTDLTEIKKIQRELEQTNMNLESAVQQRTKELTKSNNLLRNEIAERIHAQRALAKSERKYRELVTHAPAGIYEIDFKTRKFLSVNDLMCQLSGYSREELLAMNPFDILTGESKKLFQSRIEQWMLGETPDDNIEYRVITKDKREIYVVLNVTYTLDDQGNPSIAEVIGHDITERKKAEIALAESEARFRSVLDNSLDVIYRVNLQSGKHEYISPSVIDVVGYTAEEVMAMDQKTAFSHIHPQDLPELKKKIRQLQTSGHEEMEYRQLRKNGEYCWISNHMSILWDKKNRPLFRDGNIRDITDRKMIEEELRKNEQRLKYHFENSPIAVIEWDSEFIVKRWSNEAEKIFGWKALEILGRRIDDFHMIEETDRKLFGGALERFTHGMGNTEISSTRNLTKSGEVIDCNWRNSILLDKDGKMESVMSLVEDVTERNKAQSDLFESQKKLKLALEIGQIGIWEWDMVTNEVYCDKRTFEIFGIEPEEFNNTYNNFEKFLHEEDITHFENTIRKATNENIPFATIFRIIMKNGEWKYINAKGVVEKNKKSGRNKLIGVLFDITEMKKSVEKALFKLNEDLLRSNKQLAQFAYVASHDLQEPLRMITSFTQLLARRYGESLNNEAKEFIQFAVDGAYRMQKLINDLLAYSRINTRGKEFTRSDMNLVLQKVLNNLRNLVQDSDTEITTENLPFLYIDEGQMGQLLQNLIMNGIKFNKNVPRIHISCKEDSEFFTISVKDNGVGIERQYFERIFQLFQRLSTEDGYEGTGIGLSICKNIVERHGGKIWVESEVNKGSTFYFSIPKAIHNFNSINPL